MEGTIQLKVEAVLLPDNRIANVWVAHEFISVGIKTLDEAKSIKPSSIDGNPSSAVAWLGKAAVGMACLAQGFELFLRTIAQAEKLSVPTGRPHEIVNLFKSICDKSKKLPDCIEAFVGIGGEANPMESAVRLVEELETNFFAARYFGVGKTRTELAIVDPLVAARLAMALATTYPMLQPICLAKSIGFKTKYEPSEM